MNNARHIPEDDLALFALALMPPEEAAYTAAHLKHCDLCREEVARMQGDLVVYAMSAEMHDAPAGSRERFLAAVHKEKRSFIPEPPPEPVLPQRNSDLLARSARTEEPVRRGPGFFSWFGWAVAAGAAGAAFWFFHQGEEFQRQITIQSAVLDEAHRTETKNAASLARAQQVLEALTDPAAMQVSLNIPANAAASTKPEGHASYNPHKGTLVFVGTHLRPIEPGKTYELWLLPAAAGKTPVRAGLFRPDARGNASVVLPALPRGIAAKGFGVTVEDEGGSDTPTPPILLAGT